MKRQKTAILVSILILSTSLVGAAHAESSANFDCMNQKEVELCGSDESSLQFSGGLSMQNPPPGETLILTADKTDGSSISIHAITSSNGETSAVIDQFELNSGGGTRTILLPQSATNCGSGSYYTKESTRAVQPFYWWYNKGEEPASNSIYRIQEAFNTWEYGKNRCNTTVIPNSFASTYKGLTTDGPSMQNVYTNDDSGHSVVMCGVQTSKHIVFWGWLDPDYLAVTCTTPISGGYGHSSIRINSDLPWYTTLDMASCDSKWDLKGTLTHEVGHVLGLDHFTHVGQTMRFSASMCDMNMRGLGYGDVHGAASVFPPSQ